MKLLLNYSQRGIIIFVKIHSHVLLIIFKRDFQIFYYLLSLSKQMNECDFCFISTNDFVEDKIGLKKKAYKCLFLALFSQ